jgi:hypothetical protein
MLRPHEAVVKRQAVQAPVMPRGQSRGHDRISLPVLRPREEAISLRHRVTRRFVTTKNAFLVDRGHQGACANTLAFACQSTAGQDHLLGRCQYVAEGTPIRGFDRIRGET